MLDSYAIKKIAPRLLVGIILINLSLYMVTALSEMTRVVANGAGSLITAPIRDRENFEICGEASGPLATESGLLEGGISQCDAAAVAIFVLLIKNFSGALDKGADGKTGLRTFVDNFFDRCERGSGETAVGEQGVLPGLGSRAGDSGLRNCSGGRNQARGELGHFILFVIIIPIGLLFLAILVTLVFRQGLLVFLAVAAPIACALYIFPGTEKYFKKWGELFIKTLMVYPVIIMIFAIADFLASLIFRDSSNLADVVAGLIALFAPLILIPFAFKFAGGAIGAIYGAVSSSGTKLRQAGFINKEQEHAKQAMSDRILESRYAAYNQLKSRIGDQNLSPGKRRSLLRAQRTFGGRNIQARISELNERKQKELFAQIATGPDSLIRALTVDKEMADRLRGEWVDGQTEDEYSRIKDGKLEYRTLGGAWVSQGDVADARRSLGTSDSAFQSALTYEMQKASTQEEQDHLVKNYANIARARGMSQQQANEAWIGSAFAKQNENRQYKHYSWGMNENGTFGAKVNGLNLMREIDEKQGSYAMLQQSADTWTTMSQEVETARQVLDTNNAGLRQGTGESDTQYAQRVQQAHAAAQETLDRAARIAYATRSSSYSDTGMGTTGEGDDKKVEPMLPTGDLGRAGRAAGAGAPGRVQEEINRFLAIADRHAGIYQAPESNPSDPSHRKLDVPGPRESLDVRHYDNDRER